MNYDQLFEFGMYSSGEIYASVNKWPPSVYGNVLSSGVRGNMKIYGTSYAYNESSPNVDVVKEQAHNLIKYVK
ncbi:hypothetical protein Catovirus_1_265 [Catovirus CTV1]|uniref:Uncharacterized protein n=1 Tax=Catovirus CTV1 TaxID=1977631 RepID=A0A1V0S926_9VIRU|nr:hypothetical protein Catovirus_1_265 [Catovirus CTV1]